MKAITILMLGIIALLVSCQQTGSSSVKKQQKGMIKVTILYANDEGKTFDMDYYANKHMPLVAERLGNALKGLEIDQGVAGSTPDEPAPYLAIGYLYFDKLSDYQEAFAPHAEEIIADIPNYTNIQPVVQISRVVNFPMQNF